MSCTISIAGPTTAVAATATHSAGHSTTGHSTTGSIPSPAVPPARPGADFNLQGRMNVVQQTCGQQIRADILAEPRTE